jgi:hypothetical protein
MRAPATPTPAGKPPKAGLASGNAGRRDAVPEPLGVPAALSVWQVAPLIDAALIIMAACYLAGSWHVGRRHPARPWPAARKWRLISPTTQG